MENASRKNSKLLRVIAFVLATVMLLSACGAAPANPDQPENNQPAAPELNENVETAPLDHLNIGVAWLPASLTPLRNTGYQHALVFRYLYDRLAFQTSEGYAPQAAKSWEVADDGVTWTVELYDYIYDAAGNHITAADVVWYIEEYRANGLKPCFAEIESITQTGDYTFEVVMKKAVSGLFEICLISTFIVSKDAYLASPDGFATETISTSPYKVTSFAPENALEFELRDDYWQKAELVHPELATNVKSFKLMSISEASQQQVALETGTVDCFSGLNMTMAMGFENNPKFTLVQNSGLTGDGMYFSGHESRVVANDQNLRLAICHAIDTETFLNVAYTGIGELMHSIIPNSCPDYPAAWDEVPYYPYDVELAKEYLAKSNYKGEELSFMVGAGYERQATIIQENLKAIGVNMKPEVLDFALFASKSFDGINYDMMMIPVGNGIVNVLYNRFNMEASPNGDIHSRKDPEFQKILENCWLTTNYNEENLTKANDYLREQAYAYGLVLTQNLSVFNNDLGLVKYLEGSNFLGQDFIACEYAAK